MISENTKALIREQVKFLGIRFMELTGETVKETATTLLMQKNSDSERTKQDGDSNI